MGAMRKKPCGERGHTGHARRCRGRGAKGRKEAWEGAVKGTGSDAFPLEERIALAPQPLVVERQRARARAGWARATERRAGEVAPLESDYVWYSA